MKVLIKSSVVHDGKELEVGKPVDLPQEDAEALVKAGAAEPVAKAQAPKPES